MFISSVTFSTQEVADLIGVTKRTILRWLKAGLIPEPIKQDNGYRVWTGYDVAEVTEFARRRKYKSMRRQQKVGL